MPPQLLIFDLDGTLIDSRADLTAGINHMRARYKLEPLTLETVSGYVGDGVRKLVERSLQGASVDADEALQINKDYYFSHLTVHTATYDGVEEGIRQLAAAGHAIALLTNKPGDPSRRLLRHFGIAEYFCTAVGGGDTPNLKPAPDGIFECMEASGFDSSHAWMIGDHYTDLLAAENAGIKSAFVRYGFGDERGHKPDAYFASFSELVGYFV
ncbi:HAD family hydrolase [Pontiella sulfatireligans]|uniref:phosphoglycolate phosphatase n=1 Tax=Pontiella sulfatireligans TaxID=2750658 RepID=A0A6C2UEF9_9BACT|nr:HAD-IA family hydrolase [Pontiella sulfatireligans]VGO18498.1 Phosphoglycolate phosphatase [Pontiella sulfatireligans]